MAKVPCKCIVTILCLTLWTFGCVSVPLSEDFAGATERRPRFNKLTVLSQSYNDHHAADLDYRNVEFEVTGGGVIAGLRLKATGLWGRKDESCKWDDAVGFNVSEVAVQPPVLGRYAVRVPWTYHGDLFLCVADDKGAWHHQGPHAVVTVPPANSASFRRKRQKDEDRLVVHGLRMETNDPHFDFDKDGVPSILAEAEYIVRLFGVGFVEDMSVTFTGESGSYGDACEFPVARAIPVVKESFARETVRVRIQLPPLRDEHTTYYICVKDNNSTTSAFVHQGTDPFLQITTYTNTLPLWATIVIVITCLFFSALFSGLNLGLMSLDRTELKILCNTGTDQEQKYARSIQPVRNHGNFLLCSILLGNVFVNSIFTILLDGLTSGMIAVIFSTIAIVLFGEITPQAICSRHGLAIGAKTIYITKVVMALTFPLAYPVSKILDCLLGEEIGNVYNRERLKELVKVNAGENDLDKDEVNIISGALELRKKTVADVMTKIEDVFMLDYEAVLDFGTVSEIMKSGYSRVPVYEGTRQNIVTMLYIKDLAFVDPDDNTPLKTLCQFYQNPINFVFEDVTLDVMFKIFKEGNKGHMAFVHRVNNEGEGDPFYETIGLITLEDVIEELIQAEIMDETDVFTDNRTKRRRNAERRQDFSVFAERRGEGNNKIHISPQLTLAAYQFLSTAVEQFVPSVISETILKRLLKQDIVYHIKKNKDWRSDPLNVIYQQGKPSDYFVLVLEGRVEVTIGKENLTFEGGPFTYFGTQALIQSFGVAESPSVPTSTMGSLESLNLDAMLRHTFQPDYSVRACAEVVYLRIKRSLYLAAKRATLMERSQKDVAQSQDHFDEEVDKLLHSLEEDDGETVKNQSPKNPDKAQESGMSALPSGAHVSHNTSPKSSLLYSTHSPPHRLKDINGSIKSSPVDDIEVVKDEETSLLPRTSS